MLEELGHPFFFFIYLSKHPSYNISNLIIDTFLIEIMEFDELPTPYNYVRTSSEKPW